VARAAGLPEAAVGGGLAGEVLETGGHQRGEGILDDGTHGSSSRGISTCLDESGLDIDVCQ
jgi:hypothetical protein